MALDEQGTVDDPGTIDTPKGRHLIVVALGLLVIIGGIAAGITLRHDTEGATDSPNGLWRADAEPKPIGDGVTSNLSIAASQDGDVVAVAWYSESPDGPKVRVTASVDAGSTFTDPVLLDGAVESPDLFVLDDRSIVLGAYASTGAAAPGWPVFYRSDDGGASFTKIIDLHEVVGEQTDRSTLPSASISGDGKRLVVAWHDHAHHDMSHSSAPVNAITSVDGGKTWTEPRAIAPASCHCCWISTFIAGDELGVGFRDQLDVDAATDERDTAFVMADSDGNFGTLQETHDDQWVMEREGCPASGPRFTAEDDVVQAVWWTGANNVPKFLYGRGTRHEGFAEPQQLVTPGGDGDAVDSGNFAIDSDRSGTAWIMSSVFPVNASGYNTLLWQATDAQPPTLVDTAAHPYGATTAGYDVAAVDGGAIITFRDVDNDRVMLQRVAG